jgi:cobalt/nickel transport system ATP-binding protein
MTCISIENGGFSYPGAALPLFEHLEFSICNSDRTGLTGENGTGKTTLFYVITGLVRLNSGRVYLDGEPIEDERGFRRVRQVVGLLFQNSEDQLFSPTVLEDVAFGPLNMGLSPVEAEKKARDTLEMLNMSDYADRLSHKLSGGEKKLAALATILSMEPDILLLDEPTNDLDPGTRERLVDILNSLETGMVIISHDWDFLDRTTDRLVVMEKGRVEELLKEDIHVHRHIHRGGRTAHEHGV